MAGYPSAGASGARCPLSAHARRPGAVRHRPDATPPSQGRQGGMYHAAWEVASIQDLAKARLALQQAGSLAGESDHGNSLSLYAKDPDGVEIEVFWMLPREEWEKRGFGTRRLDLEGELALRAN